MVGNPELARRSASPVARLASATFVVGTCLAGLAGVMIAPLAPVQPFMGLDYILMAFFVLVVGGLGSVGGLFTGAAVIGGVDSIVSAIDRQHRRLFCGAGARDPVPVAEAARHLCARRLAPSLASRPLLLLPLSLGEFWAYQLGLLVSVRDAPRSASASAGAAAGFLPLGQGAVLRPARLPLGPRADRFDEPRWLLLLLPLAAHACRACSPIASARWCFAAAARAARISR